MANVFKNVPGCRLVELMLVTVKHVQKVFEKVPASDVSKKVEYLLNTGNLVSQSGLDLNQVCCVGNLDGFTILQMAGAR